MSISLGDIVLTIGADDSGLNSVLGNTRQKALSWVGSFSANLASELGGRVVAAVGHGLYVGATNLLRYGEEAILAAGRVEELAIINEVLARNAGLSQDEVNKATEAVRNMGIESATSQQVVAKFIQNQLDLSKASDLARVAQDAAVISGQNSTEATNGLLQGIITLQPEVLRTYGIFVDSQAAYDQYAESVGKTSDALTIQERQQAMLNAVLEEGEDIAGAYEAAMKTASKQIRSWPRYLNDILVAAGQPFQGAFDNAAGAVSNFLKNLGGAFEEGGALYPVMEDLSQVAGDIVDYVTDLAENINFDEVATQIGKVVDFFGKLWNGYGDVFDLIFGPEIASKIRPIFETIGKFFQETLFPALGALLTGDIGKVLEILFGPGVSAKVMPVLQAIGDFVINKLLPAIDSLLKGDVSGVLEALFGPDVAAKVMPTLTAIGDWIMNVAIPFATEHAEEIKGALIGIGVALAAAGIVSTIVAIATAVAGLASPIGLVLAVAGLLGAAWAGNWGGIQEKTAAVWAWLQPMLQQLGEWLQTNIPIAIAKLKDAWTNVLWPAIQTVWAWLKANIFPLFLQLAEWLGVNIPIAIQTLSDGWNGFMLAIQTVWAWLTTNIFPLFQQIADWLQINIPAALIYFSNLWTSIWTPILTTIQTVWAWLSMYLFPIFSALSDLIGTALNVALTVLAGIWQNVLLPAIQIVWAWISTNLLPVLSAVADVISSKWQSGLEAVSTLWTGVLLPAMKKVADWITTKLNPVIQPLSDWLKNVFVAALKQVEKAFIFIKQAIKGMTDALENIELPSWLTPGSPTPFEMGLRGIHDALSQINGASLPEFSAGLNLTGSQMPAMAAAGIGGGGSVTNIYIDGMQLPGIGLDTSIGEIVNKVMQFMNKGR